jgi:hypothetical protein
LAQGVLAVKKRENSQEKKIIMLLILGGFSMGITIAIGFSSFLAFIVYSIYLSSLVPRNRAKFPYYDPIKKKNVSIALCT